MKPFGKLDLDHLNERYDSKLVVGGATIAIDLNIENGSLTKAKANAVETFVASIESYAVTAKAFIDRELANKRDTTVKDFLTFHLEELPPNVLAKLVDEKTEQALLAKLVLERIGLYPDTKGAGFAIFDFTFAGNAYVKGRRRITDQIIAVYLDAKGKVGHLSHES